MVYLSQMRTEHPLIVALVEAFSRKAGIEPPILWDALDGKPADPVLVAGLVEAFHPAVRAADFVVAGGLPSAPNRDMFGAPMQAQTTTESFEGRPPTDHPFVNALRARGETLTAWCDEHKIERAAVKGWYTPGKGARRIPMRWAKLIEKEFGLAPGRKVPLLPAIEAIWRNGIKQ